MFTLPFWKDALERAVKTAAQAVVVGLGIGEGLDFFAVDWNLGLGFALGGFAASILSSLISAPFGAKESASILT